MAVRNVITVHPHELSGWISTHYQKTLSPQTQAMREFAGKRGWAIAVQIK